MDKPNGKRIIDTVQINGMEILVKELTVGEILDLFTGVDKGSTFEVIATKADQFLGAACGISVDTLKTMAPSQIKIVYEKFREVNSAFFEMAHLMAVGEIVETVTAELKASLVKDFSALCSSSLKPGTGTPGITASIP